MNQQLVQFASRILDKLGFDGDRIVFKTAIVAYNLGLKKKVDNSNPINFGEFKLFIDQYDTLLISDGIDKFEQVEVNTLLSFIKEDSVIVDIGANMGYYTVRCALKAKFGKVISFEPDPGNFEILRKNTILNNISNAALNNAAVSNKSDVMRLYKHPFNVGDYRLYNDGDFTEFVDVQTIKLDEFLQKETKIDLIKIDVQGFEYIALSGAKEILKKFRPVIFSEFWPRGLFKSGSTPADYLQLMEDLGYKVKRIDETSKKVVCTNYDALRKMSRKPVNRYTNLMFYMEEET